MTGWTPDVSQTRLIVTIIVQGFGLGFLFIPLQMVAFATLPVMLRTDGASLFSLARNIGAAIGVSITSAMLAHNTQALHAEIGAHVNPFNRALQDGGGGAAASRSGDPPWRGDAGPDDQPAGADHRLYGRLQDDDLHHAAGAAAAVPDAPPASLAAPAEAHAAMD